MKKSAVNWAFLIFAVFVMVFSIWGPEWLARYKDKSLFGKVDTRTSEMEGEGYRYRLNIHEKLYILSECLNSQSLPESEQNALTRLEEDDEGEGYQGLEGTYAFVVNHRGPSGKEITDEEIFATCNEMVSVLKDLGILPETVKEVGGRDYDAVLYSAIDVLEPRNNVAVWKVSLSTNKKNADKANRLLDAYLDADDGKVYEFYARTELAWEDIDPDGLIEKWSEYMGLESPQPYENANPLMESTPCYRKYVFSGMGEGNCIVTVGFYEGINELFLKVSR